jgi:hypothetical protein
LKRRVRVVVSLVAVVAFASALQGGGTDPVSSIPAEQRSRNCSGMRVPSAGRTGRARSSGSSHQGRGHAVNRGKGLTPEQKQRFQSEQLAKAQNDFGTSNIELDVTYTAGRYDVGPNGNPVITGARSGFLNLVVSNGTPSGAAGDSGADRRTGLAVSFLNINDASEHNLCPLSMNTTEHEFGHQFLGHVYMNPGGFVDTLSKEFGVDTRLFGQTLGVSQGAFRVGLEPRDYANPADGPDQ